MAIIRVPTLIGLITQSQALCLGAIVYGIKSRIRAVNWNRKLIDLDMKCWDGGT